MYGIILVRLVSVPPPPYGKHDWPFLGTYLISSIITMSLLILNFTTSPFVRTKYDLIFFGISSLRLLIFLSLATISEILRVRLISLPDFEAGAREPLKTNGETHYGTFDAGPTHPHSGRGGFGSNPPPQGGWMAYIQSFKVPT